MFRLLIVDDDELILNIFRLSFFGDEIVVQTAMSADQAESSFRESRPDAVICDIQLGHVSGLDLYRTFREIDPKVPVIFMTGQGTAHSAIEAMRLGAFDYLLKPIDADAILRTVARALETRRLMRVPAVVFKDGPPDDSADILIGNCPAMQAVYLSIGRVAEQDVTVLLLGETGTGKEVVARAIYHYSRRSQGPFLAVNCAAIPETLLESELFGHERGAFTGADRKRIGKFEQCQGGTLFLDEIGDMTPLTQAKILRVLQDQKFERIGGSETISTDVRIIAATNCNLSEMVTEGRFRADLFYRLDTYTIRLPPLRERGGDIALIAEYFRNRICRQLGKQVTNIEQAALEAMLRYSWPGNIRELQSVLKRAILDTAGPMLRIDTLGPEISCAARQDEKGKVPTSSEAANQRESLDLDALIMQRLRDRSSTIYNDVVHEVERHLFRLVLAETHGNLTQAARLLGINRATIRSRLAACGMAVGRWIQTTEQ